MKRLFQNKVMFFSIIGAVILFLAVSSFVLNAGATVKAAVLNADTKAGTTITESMLKEIDVPKGTPGDFYKSSSSLVGERLVNNMSEDQLIYPGDLMSSIDFVGGERNDDYIVTSVTVPDEQALGGLITANDVVDIAVAAEDPSALARLLPEFDIDSSSQNGIYYILSNVTILDATTSVASEQGSTLAATISSAGDSNSSGAASTYMLSLSYNDYKKLRIAAQCGSIWMNLAPEQNKENAPLLDEMTGGVIGGLTDAVNGMNMEGKNPAADKYESMAAAMGKTKASANKQSQDSNGGSDNANGQNQGSSGNNEGGGDGGQ